MLSRRGFVLGLAASTLVPATALAHHTGRSVPPPQNVRFSGYAPGTLIVDGRHFFLYLQLTGGRARRYPISVGRAGLTFRGAATVGRKAEWPRWTPTANMIRRDPGRYARHRHGMPGGPNNPLGARALYLYRNGRDTMYRIHGTNAPSSIGRAVSNGCIRMLNDHVVDLYGRVRVGARVVAL